MFCFSADTHLNHKNIIEYCSRPFSTIEEMNETIIENFNDRIMPDDTLYHLGDFSFGDAYRWRKRFKCKNIFLIRGNHDKSGLKDAGFGWVKDTHNLIRPEGKEISIFLSHYGHRVWPSSHHGSYHLYGHSHGKLPSYGKSFDVGVDCFNFIPISLDTVIGIMDTEPL